MQSPDREADGQDRHWRSGGVRRALQRPHRRLRWRAGAKAFDAVRSLFPPGTLVARSGSGGYHAYFSFDGTRGAHPFTWEGERAGEIRGEGALVVLPPSKHPEGGQYEWINQ